MLLATSVQAGAVLAGMGLTIAGLALVLESRHRRGVVLGVLLVLLGFLVVAGAAGGS